MSLQRLTRKFASPTTGQPFPQRVQAQLQDAVITKQLFLHSSRFWVTHSQAVRLCGTEPKPGSKPTHVKMYSETVLPFESIEASQRKGLLARTPPYFGLGVGIFVDGRWKQVTRPPALIAQLNPSMADRRLYIDTDTAVDLGLIPLSKAPPKSAVELKGCMSMLRLFHASQLAHPNRCAPPEGLAINAGSGRRWVQPAHDVLVAAGVLLGYVSPMWITTKQATNHFGLTVVRPQNVVKTHLREGIAVPWRRLPDSAKKALLSHFGPPPNPHTLNMLDLGQWERIDQPRVADALQGHSMWVTDRQVELVLPNRVNWKHLKPYSVDLAAKTVETFVNAENCSDPRIVQPRDRAFILVSGRFISQAFTDELMRVAVRRDFVSPLWFTRGDLARVGVSIRKGEKPVVLSASSTATEEYLHNIEDIVGYEDLISETPPLTDAGHQVYLVNWRPVVAPGKLAALNATKRKLPLWISATELQVSGYELKPNAKRYKLLGGICGRRPSSEGGDKKRIIGRAVFNAEQTTDPVRATATARFLVRNKAL